MTEARRGRPPQIKKGKSTWKPASAIEVVDKDPDYVYRWSNKTADNLAKKAMEGWETVSGTTGDNASLLDADRIKDGKQLTSTHEKHDVILQRIPVEMAEARREYYQEKTDRRTAALTEHIEKDARERGTKTHGEITISSTRGEN